MSYLKNFKNADPTIRDNWDRRAVVDDINRESASHDLVGFYSIMLNINKEDLECLMLLKEAGTAEIGVARNLSCADSYNTAYREKLHNVIRAAEELRDRYAQKDPNEVLINI